MNLDSGGSSIYSNYAFNSFALNGGKYYGAGPACIFELDGDTDADDTPIRARVSLGVLDFGTPEKKTVAECYVRMAGLVAECLADGELDALQIEESIRSSFDFDEVSETDAGFIGSEWTEADVASVAQLLEARWDQLLRRAAQLSDPLTRTTAW